MLNFRSVTYHNDTKQEVSIATEKEPFLSLSTSKATLRVRVGCFYHDGQKYNIHPNLVQNNLQIDAAQRLVVAAIACLVEQLKAPRVAVGVAL